MSLLSLARKITRTEKQVPRRAKSQAAPSVAAQSAPESPTTQTVLMDIYPLVSEKSVALQEQQVATFRVPHTATKQQVAAAFYQRYGSRPRDIRLLTTRPRRRRRGGTQGYTAAWKKAYVVVDDVKALWQ